MASLRTMQAEGDIVRLTVSKPEPLDFAAFFADEHAGLLKLLYFVTGNRERAASSCSTCTATAPRRPHGSRQPPGR